MKVENLKNYRYQLDLTQVEVANILGVTKQNISLWEKKNCVPDKHYEKICELYKIKNMENIDK